MIGIKDYFHNLTHKVTINVVGVGGTGSHVINNLCKIHKTLRKLNHPGLHVIAYDNDIIEENNIGRQLYFPQDIGKNKATTIISRANRSYGLSWEAIPERFLFYNTPANFIITCIDTLSLRLDLSEFTIKRNTQVHEKNFYWIDIGNNKMKGQIYLNDFGNTMPNLLTVFPSIIDDHPKEHQSCSIIDSLNSQELFINECMAMLATDMLYRFLKNKEIKHNLIFVDLENYNIQSKKIINEKKEEIVSRRVATRSL